MREDYADDEILTRYLESSKADLKTYFEAHYANRHPVGSSTSVVPPAAASTSSSYSPQKNFTARYQRKAKTIGNELEEYFKLTHEREDFECCNPIQWWLGRCAQFPNLFWLARDLFSIPGESLSFLP